MLSTRNFDRNHIVAPVQQVFNTTALSAQDSVPLFKQQTGTCGLEGFLVFFFPPPPQLRKPTCVSRCMLK